jgi:hypothetical protein
MISLMLVGAMRTLVGKISSASEGRAIQKIEPKKFELVVDPKFPIQFQVGRGKGAHFPSGWEGAPTARRRHAGPTRGRLRQLSVPRRVK